MDHWKPVILALVVALVVLALIAERQQRRRRRPLARHSPVTAPERSELGMEATDLASVQGILDRNAALPRKTGAGARSTSWIDVGAATPPREPQDHPPGRG